MSSKRKKFKLQSHYDLAERIDGMLRVLYSIPSNKRSDEDKAAIKSLEDQSADHYRKAILTGDQFIMIT